MSKSSLWKSIILMLATTPPAIIVASCSNGSTSVQTQEQKIQQHLQTTAQAATFSVINKECKASEVTSEQIIWNEASKNQDLGFKVSRLIPDDVQGQLGLEVIFFYEQIEVSVIINPNDPRAISGFSKNSESHPDPSAEAVRIELERIANNINQIVIQNEFTFSQMSHWQQQPTTFKTQLHDLKESEFHYEVLSFTFNPISSLSATQQKIPGHIIFNLEVSQNTSSSSMMMVKEVVGNLDSESNGDKPWYPNPDFMRQHEIRRLNQLQSHHILKQNAFKQVQLDALKANPTLFLNNIIGFVPQQYFQYQINPQDFSIEKQPHSDQAFIKLKIAAQLWRADDKKVIKSNQLRFAVTVIPENPVVLPPTVTSPYRIVPKAGISDMTDPQTPVITIDLHQDKSLNVALIDFNDGNQTEQLFYALIKERSDLFFDINGSLPHDWEWEKYATFMGADPILTTSTTPTGMELTAQFEYVDSNFQPFEDAWFVATIKLTNMFSDPSQKPPTPKPQAVFDGYRQKFEQLIASQQLDEIKMHTGFEGVYQFANLTTSPTGAGWTNFLNFSPSEFYRDSGFRVNVKVFNDSINYLTNEISFKWKLVGEKELKDLMWESPQQTIKYVPNSPWSDPVSVETEGDLALAPGSLLLNDIMDRFQMNPHYVSLNQQKEMLAKLGVNWTWKAREFATFLRFTFYQAFANGASALNIGIENPPHSTDLMANPNGYDVVLKARLNNQGQGHYSPYIQVFGSLAGLISRQFSSGDIVELRLHVKAVESVPFVLNSASEILPGLGVGGTWGFGKGYSDVILNQPQRTDYYSSQMGTYDMSITVNNNTYMTPTQNHHRFMSMNLFNRYNFSDAFWPEPVNPGWYSDLDKIS